MEGTICAIWVEGNMRNIFNLNQWFRRCCVKIILCLALAANLFVQRGTFGAILVEDIMRNTYVKF